VTAAFKEQSEAYHKDFLIVSKTAKFFKKIIFKIRL